MTDLALALGRVLLVGIFIFSGVGKLLDISGSAAAIAGKGLPYPQLLAVGAGVAEAIGGLAILIGWQTRLAALGLLLFTVVATYLFHDFWNLSGAARTGQMTHAWKNLSMMGALLMLAAVGAGRWSVDRR